MKAESKQSIVWNFFFLCNIRKSYVKQLCTDPLKKKSSECPVETYREDIYHHFKISMIQLRHNGDNLEVKYSNFPKASKLIFIWLWSRYSLLWIKKHKLLSERAKHLSLQLSHHHCIGIHCAASWQHRHTNSDFLFLVLSFFKERNHDYWENLSSVLLPRMWIMTCWL